MQKTEQPENQIIKKEDRDKWLAGIKAANPLYESLSTEEKELITKATSKVKYGYASSVPMICSPNCPIKDQCPFFKINKLPLDQQCPIELDSLHYHIQKYADEFNLNPSEHSELILLTELAECIVIEDRATKMLPPDLMLRQTRFTPQGDSYEDISMHPLNILKDKYKARRLKILESLSGTRKEKIKHIKAVVNNSAANALSDLKKELDKLKSKKEVNYNADSSD